MNNSKGLFKINLKSIILTTLMLVMVNCSTMGTVKSPIINEKAPLDLRKEAFTSYRFHFKGHYFWGYTINQGLNQDILSFPQIEPVVSSMSPEAEKSFKEGNTLSLFSQIFAGVTGACIGWPLGIYLGSGQFPGYGLAMLGVGGGSLIVSYIFASIATDKYNKSIDEYNAVLAQKLGLDQYQSWNVSPVSNEYVFNHDPKFIEQKFYLSLASISF